MVTFAFWWGVFTGIVAHWTYRRTRDNQERKKLSETSQEKV